MRTLGRQIQVNDTLDNSGDELGVRYPVGGNISENSNGLILDQVIKYYELVANGTNYIGLKGADNLASTVIFTLPSADGTGGQSLVTNGTGTFSFSSMLPLVGGTLSGFLTLNADPTSAMHAATKQYVDNLLRSWNWKSPGVRVTDADANVNIATELENGDILNGVTLITNNRVLLRTQTAPEENGIYEVQASGAAIRSADMNDWSEVVSAVVVVSEGTLHADTVWLCTDDAGGMLGTDPVTFMQLPTAGGGLTGTLATNQIPYATGITTVAGNSNFVFDNTSTSLSLGIATFNRTLNLHTTSGIGSMIQFTNSATGSTLNDGTYMGVVTGSTDFYIINQEGSFLYLGTNNGTDLGIDSSGNVEIYNDKVLRLYDTDNSHFTGFRAHATTTTSETYVLPPADGVGVLGSDGSANLAWISGEETSSIEWETSATSLKPHSKSILKIASISPELAASGLVYSIESGFALNYGATVLDGVGVVTGNWTFFDSSVSVNIYEGAGFPNYAWLKYRSVACWLVPQRIKTGINNFKFATTKQAGVAWEPSSLRPGLLKPTVSSYSEFTPMATSELTTTKAQSTSATSSTAILTNGSQTISVSASSKLLMFLSGIHNGSATKYLENVSVEVDSSTVGITGLFPDITAISGTFTSAPMTYGALSSALSSGSHTVDWIGSKFNAIGTETALLSSGVYVFEVPSSHATVAYSNATPGTVAILTQTDTITIEQDASLLCFVSYNYPSTTGGAFSRFKIEVDTGSGFEAVTGLASDPYLVHNGNENDFKYVSYLHVSEPIGTGSPIDVRLTLQSSDIDCENLTWIVVEYR